MSKIEVDEFGDALMIAGAKIVSERSLAPMIGNGTIQSGVMKLLGAKIIGSVAKGVDKRLGRIVETALIVDGAEDIATSLMANVGMPFGARAEPEFM